jgi:hypothetical protein
LSSTTSFRADEAGSSPHFHETASITLVVRSFRKVPGKSEERQQFSQVNFQASYHRPVLPAPFVILE